MGFSDSQSGRQLSARANLLIAAGVFLLLVVGVLGYLVYSMFWVQVPYQHMLVLINKTGLPLENDMEVAPSSEYQGIQLHTLGQGRHFLGLGPLKWDWEIVPMVIIPNGKLGVRVRLYGDDLPPGEIVAWKENQKGIVPEVLEPGLYAINAQVIDGETKKEIAMGDGDSHTLRSRATFVERIELYDPVTIPAGYVGVVTKLSAPMSDKPNAFLVEPGKRGVQPVALEPQTVYLNPYLESIHQIDCRSQRFNLSEEGEMGFPSKDGFWVSLDGYIEFRVSTKDAAQVFVTFNEDKDGDDIDKEIVSKIILPNARAYCRLYGSDYSGVELISGVTRTKFQEVFLAALSARCKSQGIEIVNAVIRRVEPPEKIASPVRKREIALQEELQYRKQRAQQESEQELAVEKQLVERKQVLVQAEQRVNQVTTEAQREQAVAVIEANQRLKVAEVDVKAAEDRAAATLSRGKAAADVIRLDNLAEAAGWEKSVAAFSGSGDEFARWTLLKKLAPAYRKMMVNTANSPIMDIFRSYTDGVKTTPGGSPPITEKVAQPQ